MPAASETPTGRVIEGGFEHAEGTRSWRLFAPPGPLRPRTLLVVLHGCLQSPADIAAGSRMDAVASEQGFLVLYPDQPTSANPRRCWNWFEEAHQRRGAGEPALLAALIAQVASSHRADPRRVHVAGISAGAAMAGLVAAAYPERFASLTMISGVAWRSASGVGRALTVMKEGGGSGVPPAAQVVAEMGAHARAVPAFILHGDRDAVLSPRNGEEAVMQWVAVHDAIRARSGLPPLTEQGTPVADVQGGYATSQRSWRDERGRAGVEWFRVAELGHAWPGGSPAGTFTDANGPDASRLIARFIAAHALDVAGQPGQ